MTHRARLVALAVVALAAPLLPSARAAAAVISPTVFTDDVTDNGNCTLREAIAAATFDMATDQCPAGSGTDTIQLRTGIYELSLPGTGEDLNADGDVDVRDTVDIIGTGMTSTVIDGNGSVTGERVFHLPMGTDGDLSLTDLTVQHGGDGDDTGAGIQVGTGTALKTLRVSILANNAGAGDGGGIDNSGTTVLTDTRVALTPASDEGGGIFTGIPATLTLDRVAIDHNTASRSGGGILMDGNALTITNTTISSNNAGDDGGGISVGAGPTNLNNVTITGNTTDTDHDDDGDGGGIYGSEVTLRNSIVAGNIDATSPPGDMAPDCSITGSTSAGHNILGNDQGCSFPAGPNDLLNVDPKLGPLADNGAFTMTHALLKGSPAIGAAGTGAAQTDQRGLHRQDPDIGAYERVLCAKVPVNRIGSNGKDKLQGTNGPDGMLGMGEKDTLNGKGGKDGLCGGGGKDKLKGGGGKDRMKGQGGNDLCVGGSGKDKATCERETKVP